MTIDNNPVENIAKNATFGARLKLARENSRLSVKDVASRLHLSPGIITLIENEQYESTTPKIFLRGYLKSYARMLNFSDADIAYALTQIDMTDPVNLPTPPASTNKLALQSSHPFMRWATSLILLLLASLVGTWWYIHTYTTDQISAPVREPALENLAPVTPEAATTQAINSAETAPIIAAPPLPPKHIASHPHATAINTTTADDADDEDATTSTSSTEAKQVLRTLDSAEDNTQAEQNAESSDTPEN